MAPPPEYDGPGDAWSPEQVLLASVGACFVFTFGSIARAAHLAYDSIEVRTSGTIGKQNNATRFTDIVVRPRITVARTVDQERLAAVIDKAEDHCLIANSLTTPTRVEPEIVVAHDRGGAVAQDAGVGEVSIGGWK